MIRSICDQNVPNENEVVLNIIEQKQAVQLLISKLQMIHEVH